MSANYTIPRVVSSLLRTYEEDGSMYHCIALCEHQGSVHVRVFSFCEVRVSTVIAPALPLVTRSFFCFLCQIPMRTSTNVRLPFAPLLNHHGLGLVDCAHRTDYLLSCFQLGCGTVIGRQDDLTYIGRGGRTQQISQVLRACPWPHQTCSVDPVEDPPPGSLNPNSVARKTAICLNTDLA